MATGNDIHDQIFALPAVDRADPARQRVLSLENESIDNNV